MKQAVLGALLALAACAVPALASPIIGVPAYSLPVEDKQADTVEFSHLVVTTATPASAESAVDADAVVRLDSAQERSRFLVTLLMLESLHNDKPSKAVVADPKLSKEILADEEVMQDVLKLYENNTQENKGKHFIKIPPKLLKKMKLKMKELLSD